MPSTITHAYFGLDVYNRLDIKTQNFLQNYKEHLKVFSQGPDFFYFYNLSNFKPGKKIREFGEIIHKNKTKNFFLKLINYIKSNHLEYNEEIISFLYGFINHYILDSTTHPYIIYKTGLYIKNNKQTKKYRSLHHSMESFIDAYFIFQNEKKPPRLFKPHLFCFNLNEVSKDLTKLIEYIFEDVYNYKNISYIYLSSIKQAQNFYKIYRYDPLGFKKYFYKIIDIISPRFFQKKEFLSYSQKISSKNNYLNFKKNEWNHPLNSNEIYNLSFSELYLIALKKAINTIKQVNNVLYDKKSLASLENIFDNTSYISGKKCELGYDFKYFEF